MVKKDII